MSNEKEIVVTFQATPEAEAMLSHGRQTYPHSVIKSSLCLLLEQGYTRFAFPNTVSGISACFICLALTTDYPLVGYDFLMGDSRSAIPPPSSVLEGARRIVKGNNNLYAYLSACAHFKTIYLYSQPAIQSTENSGLVLAAQSFQGNHTDDALYINYVRVAHDLHDQYGVRFLLSRMQSGPELELAHNFLLMKELEPTADVHIVCFAQQGLRRLPRDSWERVLETLQSDISQIHIAAAGKLRELYANLLEQVQVAVIYDDGRDKVIRQMLHLALKLNKTVFYTHIDHLDRSPQVFLSRKT